MATDFFKIGQATGRQFVDVTGAVQKGLEMGLKPFAEYEKSRKERVAALGRILQSTPNLEELPKIPAQYSPEISEWASNAKNEYAIAARTLVQTSADSAEYREAVQKMNNIKTAFVNLDNQLNGIREERIEYLDDYRNGIVSKGFKNSDIEAAYGETGKIANIDTNGNVSMTGVGGQAFKWSERQEHYNVNPFIQKSMVDLSTTAKSNGLKGISFTQDEYKEQLKAIMSDPRIGNIQGLKSLVYDDIDGTALNIVETNPEILQLLETETSDLPLIKQKLVDILAPALANVNKTSIDKYNKALQVKSTSKKSGQSALETFNRVVEDPIIYAKTYLPGAFVEGKGNIITLTVDDEPKRFDLKRGDQFMEFMNLVTTNSGELTGTSNDAKVTRGEFYDLISKARNLLNDRQEGFERMRKQLLPQFFAPETLSKPALPTSK
jgi:hypothetical protein